MGKHAAPRTRPAGRITAAALTLALTAMLAPASPVPVTGPEAGAALPAASVPVTAPADVQGPDFTRTAVPAPTPRPVPPLELFLAQWEGLSPILPGYTTAQCVAIFSHYHYDVIGGGSYSVIGAKDLWDRTWTEYAKIPASEPAQPGDVVIWAGDHGAYQGGGYGHVAIVVADHGQTLAAFGQNPNPATTLELSKAGVRGYLRPLTPTA